MEDNGVTNTSKYLAFWNLMHYNPIPEIGNLLHLQIISKDNYIPKDAKADATATPSIASKVMGK